jgi:peptidoglycan/xylan/chitin deacetylase (PgdA/CDA1 family)
MIRLIIILFIFLLILFGFWLWYRLSGLKKSLKYSSILMLHGIRERFDFSISNLSHGRFSSLLDYAEGQGYIFDRLDNAISDGEDRPAKKVLRISFDDGYQEVYGLFEEFFEPRLLPITIFMTTGYIGKGAEWDYMPRPARHLDSAELKRLASSELVTIGSHTVTHPDLSAISRDRMINEIVASKKYLEDLLGKEIKYFSYPFGRFNPRVVNEVVKAGYEAAFCGVPFRRYAQNKLFQIPRIPLYHLDNLYTFTQKVEPGRLAWLEFSKARVIELFSGLTFRVRGERKW